MIGSGEWMKDWLWMRCLWDEKPTVVWIHHHHHLVDTAGEERFHWLFWSSMDTAAAKSQEYRWLFWIWSIVIMKGVFGIKIRCIHLSWQFVYNYSSNDSLFVLLILLFPFVMEIIYSRYYTKNTSWFRFDAAVYCD